MAITKMCLSRQAHQKEHLNQLHSSKRPNGQRCSSYRGRPPSSRGEADHEGACKSMNHAQKNLAQANRQIAELTVQIARQSLRTRLARASAQRWRSRCLMRSKEAFAYSRSTGYFCSVCSVNRPSKKHQSLAACPQWDQNPRLGPALPAVAIWKWEVSAYTNPQIE